MQPLEAREGSFVLSVSSDGINSIEHVFLEFSRGVEIGGGIIEFVQKIGVNPSLLLNMFIQIRKSEVGFSVKSVDGNKYVLNVIFR